MLQKQVVSVELLNLLYELQKEHLLINHALAGGTALALQLGHRTSTDIDLFSYKEQNNKMILNMFNNKFKYYELVYIDKSALQIIVRNIKIDILSTNVNTIDDPKIEDGIRYFGMKDIAAMKLRAVLYRMKPRDYIDIAYLLNEFKLEAMFEYYKNKYNEQDLTMLKIKLLACKDFRINDWGEEIAMLKNDIKLKDIPKILESEVKNYNKKYKIGK